MKILRGSSTVEQQTHNLPAVGSSPAPASLFPWSTPPKGGSARLALGRFFRVGERA